MAFDVRPAQAPDLPALTALYTHYVVNTAITFDVEPPTVAQRAGWFAQYQPAGPYRLLVATQADTVVGYASSSRFRDKAAYDTSVETTVYCHPEHTGHGIGTLLYAALLDQLAGGDLHRAYAAIALPGEASMRLHERFGFQQVGVLREVGYKFGRYWDVAWLEREL